MQFSQPAWTEESGLPYPGAEEVADAIEKLAIEAKEKSDLKATTSAEKVRLKARQQAQQEAEKEAASLRKLHFITAADIVMERTTWLWAPGAEKLGRIPMGELTLVGGKGGVGKSTLLSTFAAWISKGEMQGEYFGHPRDIIYVANEDSLTRTVGPRLAAAGADMTRIHILHSVTQPGIDGLHFALPTDCDRIGEAVTNLGAVAVMLDPLSSNLKVDNANDQKKMRFALEQIQKMAERFNVAVIGLAHTRKSGGDNFMDSLMGSSELANVCRSAMGVMRDEADGTVVLSQEKLNVGRHDICGYKYKIEDATLWGETTIRTSRLKFVGKTDQKVSDMMATAAASGPVSRTALEECCDFITEYLQDPTRGGEAPRKEFLRLLGANGEGHSRSTIDRARDKLRLEKIRVPGSTEVIWRLPRDQFVTDDGT